MNKEEIFLFDMVLFSYQMCCSKINFVCSLEGMIKVMKFHDILFHSIHIAITTLPWLWYVRIDDV